VLTEALAYLFDQGAASKNAQVLRPEAEPKHVYAVVDPDGTLEWRDATPAPRDHKAGSLQPVVDFALTSLGTDYSAAVWYSRNGVVCLINDYQRRDRVSFAFNLSPQVNLLLELQKSRAWYSQKDFIRLLKVDLAGCLALAGNLLDVVRAVKFVNNAAGETVVAHGKTSVGRSIQQEVTGAGALPEYVTVDVPAFAQATVPYRSQVKCSLDVDPANATFQLTPLPGDVEKAVADCEKKLGSHIGEMLGNGGDKDGAVGVYFGKPE
jgi:hypothetical protein